MARLKTFHKHQAGNIAMLFAFIAPVLIVVTALVVDLAVLGHKKRELQNASDLAAILAAQNIGEYHEIALANLAANGFEIRSVETGSTLSEEEAEEILSTKAQIELGRYRPNPRIPKDQRFVTGGTPANAVRVSATHKSELYFGASLAGRPELAASSVAYSVSEAAFTVGTRLLHFNDGIANALLNATLGTDVELSVMDYEDLLDADVYLLSTLEALSSEAHLNAVTYEDVLTSDVTLGQLSAALADTAPSAGHAGDALRQIALDPTARATQVQLGDFIDLGSLSGASLGTIEGPLSVRVRALDLLTTAAGVATGEHQIELDLAGEIPGLTDLQVTLLIGERPQLSPWLSLTSERHASVETAQTRLLIEARIGGSGVLSGTEIYLPLYVELATARASLRSVDCPAGREENAEVTLYVEPAVASLWIGSPPPANLTGFSADYTTRYAQLIDTLLLDVSGRARLDVGGHRGRRVTFTAADIRNGETKTVETRRMVDSILVSLLGNLDLNIDVAGLSVTTPREVQSALAATLTPLADPLDELLDTTLSIAGVSVGEADVRVSGIYCQRSVLVQ